MFELSDFAEQVLSRKTAYVARWHHRSVVWRESLAEHHGLVARIAYELALTLNIYLPWHRVNANHVAVTALYHDEGELVVGDMPSPAKRLFPEGLVNKVEHQALEQLWGGYPNLVSDTLKLNALGEGLSTVEQQLVRYADTLAAYAFARDQVLMGNRLMADVIEEMEGPNYFGSYDWPWLRDLRAEFDLP